MKYLCNALAFSCLWLAFPVMQVGHASSTITNALLGQHAHQIAEAYGARTDYSITRNGKKIGTHKLIFQGNPSELTVAIDSSITVRILGIPVYRLSYQSTELWKNDALVSATATTKENGDVNTVSLSNLSDNEKIGFASNHWHPGVLTGDSVFNTLTGDINRVSVMSLGTEKVETVSGQMIEATHYRYQDDLLVNVWYDLNGLWLKMVFKGEDNSTIEYLRSD